ncbi:hypothetical protein V8E36_006367 [Tilletia maclaganii]
MKSLIKRRKSNANVNESPPERPREHIPAMPIQARRAKAEDLRAPTPTRFSGAGWDEFLTNISVPQAPLTPLSQSPGTPAARLPAAIDLYTPMDDAFRAARLGAPFTGATGSSPVASRSASPAFQNNAPGIRPGSFANAHMMAPTSPAPSNAFGSVPPSPTTAGPGLHPYEGRPSFNASPSTPANRGEAYTPSTDNFLNGPPTSARSPLTPSSPLAQPPQLRSPLGGPPSSPLAQTSEYRKTTQAAGSASSHPARNASNARSTKDTDQTDAHSVKSTSSSKGRSIGKFFKRNKQNSDEWPENNVPAIPKLPSQSAMRATVDDFPGNQRRGPLSPPESVGAHPVSETGSGKLGGAIMRFSRKVTGQRGAANGASKADEEDHRWDNVVPLSMRQPEMPASQPNGDGQLHGTPQLNGPWTTGPTVVPAPVPNTQLRYAQGNPASVRYGVESPPNTDGSGKASTDQSNGSGPSISSLNFIPPTPTRPVLEVSTAPQDVGAGPLSPTLLLPAASPMLRTQSSQSSLRKLIEDMNLPLDEPTPVVTVSSTDEDAGAPISDTKRDVQLSVASPRSPEPPALPSVTATASSAPRLSLSETPVASAVDDGGTDSIAALHQMLGSFDMVSPFGASFDFSAISDAVKPANTSLVVQVSRPATSPASDQASANTAQTVGANLLSAGPEAERRGSNNSVTSSGPSDAFRTPPEAPSTPIVQQQSVPGTESTRTSVNAANGSLSTGTPQSQGTAFQPVSIPVSPEALTTASQNPVLYSRSASITAGKRPMNAPPLHSGSPVAASPVLGGGGSTTFSSMSSLTASTILSPSASAGQGTMTPPTMLSSRQGPQALVTSPSTMSSSPSAKRLVLPAPKPRPKDACLAELMWTHTSVHFVQQLIGLLDFNDVKNLRQISRAFRTALNSYPCREIVLRRFLGQVGYRSWSRPKMIAPEQQPVSADPIPLSFTDAEGFLLSHHLLSEYPLVSQAYVRDPQSIDPRMLTLARATTRAYNRVLARLRAQPFFAVPPQRKLTADSTASPQAKGNGEAADLECLPSPWKPGRAALFQVWVPCANGSWLSDEELTRCEAELFKAGIWSNLQRGDVVWDCALGEEGNMGRLVYDGQFLRDLSFNFDPIGHLPSWLNILSLSPAHFHGRIRSSTGCPVVYIDLTPFKDQIGATLQLVQDSAETVSPNGSRYRVQRWVYRAKVKVTPGTIISMVGLDCVHIDWAGTITVETEGTIEYARDLINRCFGPNSSSQARVQLLQSINKGPLPPLSGEDKWSYSDKSEATSPFEIVRAKSKPGQLFIRPVVKTPQMI